MPKWTKEQQDAILAKEKNILVSAAAGSGKTAVLTERIVKMLTDSERRVSASEILVVTFTNAAAAEMRERIIAKLTDKMEAEPENEYIQRQLTLIGSASITTIHSFCLNMIRENFILAGVDPAFKIADTTENDLLKNEAISEVSNEMYEDEEFADSFIRLSESYSGLKDMESLALLASNIYNFVMSLPNPEKWLDEAAQSFNVSGDFGDTEFSKIITENTKNAIELILLQYDTMIEKAGNDDDVPEVLSLLKEERDRFFMASKLDTYNEFYNFFSSLEFKNFPREKKGFSPVYREYIKNVREGVKDTVNKNLCSKFFNLSHEEQHEAMEKLYPQVLALSEFVKRIIVRFDEKKAKRNILNFNDLEHICHRLFVDENGEKTELAKKTSERFTEILIDEYQDTSRLQESIFSAIHMENRMFMVGDIKQSIYRFRNTDPILFRDKSDRFETIEGLENRKILLAKNFRSREEVLSGINYFFLRLMSRAAGEVCYDENEMLYCGAEFPESVNPLPLETEINIIDRALEAFEDDEETEALDELTSAELEAELVADKIEELILGGFEVNDKGTMRKISYRDICILMRSTAATAPVFAEILSERGIPAFSDTANGFFESGEIDTIMSFLKIIDSPNQDIPLLAVLRSPIYNFTTNELAEIRSQKPRGDFHSALLAKSVSQGDLGRRICNFLRELEDFRLGAKVKSTHELIWDIYMKSGFYDYVGATKNGKLKQANLKNFYVRAADYDKAGFKGLHSFISFMQEYKSSGSDFASAKMLGEEQDVVRIMSIHKSKGLEFPVVILASCAKKFNLQDVNKPLLFHHKFGYGPKFVDSTLRVTYPTAARSAISSVILNETLSEEMRILYVALTRAKEKLIISSCEKNLLKAVSRWCLGENGKFKIDEKRVLSAKSYLDWMGMCLVNHPDCSNLTSDIAENIKKFYDGSHFKVNVLPPKIRKAEKAETKEAQKEEEPVFDEIIDLVNAKYKRESFVGVPSKITVTELKRRITEEDEGSVYIYKTQGGKNVQKVSAAARGTAFHTVMEHIDFAGDISVSGIKNTADNLTARGFLTPDERDSLDIEKISLFFKSDLFKKIRLAKSFDREVMFAIKEKAKKLGIANSDAEVLVQGVIDLVLIFDDEIILVDYKTDRGITPDEAAKRYRVQLICYNMAAIKLYGKAAKKAYLYLFENGEFAEIKLDDAFLSDRFDEQA